MISRTSSVLVRPSVESELTLKNGSKVVSNSVTEHQGAFSYLLSVCRFDLYWIAFFVVLGVVLRLDFMRVTKFLIDSDEAIVGLMAKHAIENGRMPIFYYGQHYMGSLESLLVAGLFWLFGISTFALKFVPFAFSIALIPATYLLAYLSLQSPFQKLESRKSLQSHERGKIAGRVAAFLMTFPPAALIEWSTKARGGFTEVILLGVCALLSTIFWYRTLALRHTFVCGLLLGIGWWVNNQIIFYMLPIGLVMLLRTIFAKKHTLSLMLPFQHFLIGVVSFLLGSAPYWYYNSVNNFISFSMLSGSANILKNFVGLFSSSLPIIAGSRHFWHEKDIFFNASIIPLILYSSVIIILYKSRKSLRPPAVTLQVLTVVATIAVFAFSSFGTLSFAPRYLLPLYPVLFGLVGVAIASLWGSKKWLAPVLLSGFVFLHAASNYWGGRYIPGAPFAAGNERASTDHKQLISWLAANNITQVLTPYWIAYRLAFETQEKVTPVLFSEPFQVRIPEYQEKYKVDAGEFPPFILPPHYGQQVTQALNVMGYKSQVTTASNYTVIYDIKSIHKNFQQVKSSDLKASASHHGESASSAIDNDRTTRWGSGLAQRHGMDFTVGFSRPSKIRAVEFDLGSWESDYPRGLTITCIKNNKEQRTVLSEEAFKQSLPLFPFSALRFNLLEFGVCNAMKFTQKGSDPIFDWSIAEVKFFE
jgi:hypothetical protein